MNSELRTILDVKVKSYNEKLRKANLPTLDYLNVRCDIRGLSLLGQYCPRTKEIRLHPVAIEKYGEEYLNDIFAHEVAHFVVDEYKGWSTNAWYRPKPHGREFKYVARILGCSPRATTDKFNLCGPTHGKKKKVIYTAKSAIHKYECNCSIYMIGAVRHNNILKGRTFSCSKCKRELEYVKSSAPKKVDPKVKSVIKTTTDKETYKFECDCCEYTFIGSIKQRNKHPYCSNCKDGTMLKVDIN